MIKNVITSGLGLLKLASISGVKAYSLWALTSAPLLISFCTFARLAVSQNSSDKRLFAKDLPD